VCTAYANPNPGLIIIIIIMILILIHPEFSETYYTVFSYSYFIRDTEEDGGSGH